MAAVAAVACLTGAQGTTWVVPELLEEEAVPAVSPSYAEGRITPLSSGVAVEARPAVGYVPLNARYMLNPYANPATYAGHAYPYPYPYDAAPHQHVPGGPFPHPYPYPHPVCTQELCVPTPMDG